MTPKTVATNLYETDYYEWIQQQLALLKSGCLAEVDLEHLIEEIEELGASKRDALVNQIARLYLHLLKWHHQAQRRSRSWEISIKNARIEIEDLLTDNPSLKSRLSEWVDKGYAKARRQAEAETGLSIEQFPVIPSLNFQQAMSLDLSIERE